MTKQEVIEMVKNPLLVNDINSEKLLALTKEYPYCHAFHLLHLKGLKNTNSIEFEKYLPTTSLNAPNREVLYDLIVKMKLREKIEQVEEEISQSVAQEVSIKPEIILPTEEEKQAEKESVVNEVEAIILEELAQQQYSLETLVNEETEEAKQPEVKELPSEMSFTQWLNPTAKKVDKKTSSLEIIDRFIKENPTISKLKQETYSAPEIAKLSLEDNDDLVTETLARVYMKQGHYDKAIKTYQKLSLKIPEKKAFFASQIEVIEELKKQK